MRESIFFKKSWRAKFTSGILIFMLVFVSLFTISLPASASPLATISAGNITLESDSYAVVGVYANNVPSPGLAGYDLDINYDPLQIEIVGITRSALFSPPIPEFGVGDLNPSPIPGKLTVVYASSSGTLGTIKLFNLKVKALQTLTDVSPFTITVKDFSGPDILDLTPTLQLPWIPDEPNVSADNQNNLIIGLAEGMEYSIDNSAFTPYNSSNLPNLSGDNTVFVRVAGIASSPPGAERMLTFNNLEQVSLPQAVVGATTYQSGNNDYIAHGDKIFLTSATSDATFYYTLGVPGSEPGDPSSGGTTYNPSTGISIPDGKTIIEVIAVKAGMDDSSIATFTFINKVSTPYIMVSGTQYNYEGTPTSLSVPQGVPVFLGSSTDDVSFYYTTDGNAPTTGDTLYSLSTGIANLPSGTTTLKVLGTKNSLANSETSTFLVTVSQSITTPPAPSVTNDDTLNTVTGMTTAMEYKYDDAATYVAYDTSTFAGLNFAGNHTLVVRIAAEGINPAGPDKTLTFTTDPVTPPAPSVTNDDLANTVTGMTTAMEYKYDSATDYVAYDTSTFAGLSFAGNHTLVVRIAAEGINPAGPDKTLTFTTDPVTPPAPSVTNDDLANTVTGMTTAMEYKYDDAATYVAYDTSTFAGLNFAGNHTLVVRIAAEGINPAGPDKTLTFTTDPVTPPAPSVTNDDTANTVTGMTTAMEYKYDDATDYVAYDSTTFAGLNLAGNHTLQVRIAAEGINSASADTTLTFTADTVTPPTLAQISVLNNPVGTNDTVTVQGLQGGDIVKVYADATIQTILGTETETAGSVTVSIPQLGINAGTVFVSVTSPGMSESGRTAVAYSAEVVINPLNVVIGNSNGTVGRNVTVNIELNNVAGNAGLGIVTTNLTVNYDPAVFQLISIAPGSGVSPDATFITNPLNSDITNDGLNPGQIVFLENDQTQNDNLITTDGMFATIVFKIKATTTAGTYPITFSTVSTDNSLTKMTGDIAIPVDDVTGFYLVSGSVNVVNWLYGDLNGSGTITSTDLAYLQSYLLKKITQFPNDVLWQAADLNASGGITSTDLAYLQSYLLKKITKFPAQN